MPVEETIFYAIYDREQETYYYNVTGYWCSVFCASCIFNSATYARKCLSRLDNPNAEILTYVTKKVL